MSHAFTPPPTFLKLLAHDLRWRLVTALAHGDQRVQELVDLVREPPNLVSYHLKRLRDFKLVTERRSAADGRDVYYSLRLDEVHRLYLASGQALHPALSPVRTQGETTAADRPAPVRVLFLCTHNSARSQMAEGILRHLSKGRAEAFSAGSIPRGLHPVAVETMAMRGIDISGQNSKPLSDYLEHTFDYIITVCDPARESCPVFRGDPEQIHWSFPDPAAVSGTTARRRAFGQTAHELTTRINYLLLLIDHKRSGNCEGWKACGSQ